MLLFGTKHVAKMASCPIHKAFLNQFTCRTVMLQSCVIMPHIKCFCIVQCSHLISLTAVNQFYHHSHLSYSFLCLCLQAFMPYRVQLTTDIPDPLRNAKTSRKLGSPGKRLHVKTHKLTDILLIKGVVDEVPRFRSTNPMQLAGVTRITLRQNEITSCCHSSCCQGLLIHCSDF